MKKVKIIAIILLLIILCIYAYLSVTNFFEIDECLDKGCTWDNSMEQCNC